MLATYTIEISEEQRVALVEVLKKHNPNRDENYEPGALAYWIEMLEELPTLSQSHIGVHSFCL